MRIKRYLLHAGVGVLAFCFGVLNCVEYQFVLARFRAPEKQQVAVAAIEPEIVDAAPPYSPEPESAPVMSDPELATNFDMSGEYESANKLPSSFRAFSVIEVETTDYETASSDSPNGSPIPPKGYILFDKEYKFTRIAVSQKTLAFDTEAIDGVSYRFTGKFVQEGTENTSPADLRGHLTRLKNGKKVAETGLDLYLGGC